MLKPAKNVTENVVTDQATSTMKVLQKEENVRNAKGNKKLTGNNFYACIGKCKIYRSLIFQYTRL